MARRGSAVGVACLVSFFGFPHHRVIFFKFPFLRASFFLPGFLSWSQGAVWLHHFRFCWPAICRQFGWDLCRRLEGLFARADWTEGWVYFLVSSWEVGLLLAFGLGGSTAGGMVDGCG